MGDEDGSDEIDIHKLKEAIIALGFEAKKEEMQKIIPEERGGGCGLMGYEEFLAAMTNKILNVDPRESMVAAFKMFDDDETGKISVKNLQRVAKELGERMTAEELQEMIEETSSKR